MYTDRAALRDDLAWLRERRYAIDVIDFDAVGTDMLRFHQRIAAALRFPDWYGHNLDALNDLLAYLDVPSESGRVIVLDSLERIAGVDKKLPATLCDIFRRSSYSRLLFGRRLMFFFVSDEPNVSLVWTEKHTAETRPPKWLSSEVNKSLPRSGASRQAERRRHRGGR